MDAALYIAHRRTKVSARVAVLMSDDDDAKPRTEDPDRAAILARRQHFIALALTGLATTACASTGSEGGSTGEEAGNRPRARPEAPPQPCLNIAPAPSGETSGGETSDGETGGGETSGGETGGGETGESAPPQPCLKIAAPEVCLKIKTSPRPCLKKAAPKPCLNVAPTED